MASSSSSTSAAQANDQPIQPLPPIAGPNSIASRLQPAPSIVEDMRRLHDDEMASWTGVAAIRNLVDDAMPDDQQAVVAAGAAEAVIATMNAWPEHPGIQVTGAGTLVKIAEIDAASRIRVLEAGGLFELASAVARLEKHSDSDGDMIGKHVVVKSHFARECLIKVAGKRSDPRNKRHILAAISGGVDEALLVPLEKALREQIESDAHARFVARADAQGGECGS